MTNAFAGWDSHFVDIYQNDGDRYARLVGYEDTHGELAARLNSFAVDATNIVDIGAGTGRLTIPLCAPSRHVHGVDASPEMLRVAKQSLARCSGEWTLSVADARHLPVPDGWADAAVAGWVFGHLTEWYPESWERELDAALAEMDRVVKPGKPQAVIDTLGTAVPSPGAPTPALGEYHKVLADRGFVLTVLRTDYMFPSVDEAIELLTWFFDLGDWARAHNDPIVPEYTGWWERRA